MIRTPDDSLKNFNRFLNKQYGKISESDTRSKIIDPIFLNCLNWGQKDIIREENISNNGYIDYLFMKGDRILFIVEAKKHGTVFEIPPNYLNRKYKINGVISECKELIEAIEQTQRYCVEKGVNVGIVTNGHQYVIFQSFITGREWREGYCIIFNGFEDIKKNFNLFYNYLNKLAVIEGDLHRKLADKKPICDYIRPIDTISNKDAKKLRNYLYPSVSPFIDSIFLDITEPSQIDVLKSCYIYKKAYGVTDDEILKLLQDRVPRYQGWDGIKWFEECSSSAGKFEECIKEVRRNAKRGQLVLLLGGIGSGKTTFIHRFFNVILEEETENLWFYVDFSVAPTDPKKFEIFILDSIITDFELKYANVVKDQFNKIGFEFDSDNKEKSITRLFSVLQMLNFSLTLVLDNVDKTSSEFQEKIFLTSEYIAERFSVLIILTLREESYYRSKLLGAFDAYHIQRFHISAPKFEDLIKSRIEYVLDLLKVDDDEISERLNKTIDFDGKKDDVITFFKVLRNSLSGYHLKSVTPIAKYITCISDGNMREALDIFSTFLRSGNTKVSEIIEVEKKEPGSYVIQDYQFVKSVILDESHYYRGDKNKIMNIFDFNTGIVDSHFLNLRVLNYANKNRANEIITGRGYIKVNQLMEEAEDLFISQSAIEKTLLRLAKYNLVKFDNDEKKDLSKIYSFRITATGAYYLENLINEFIYLDLIHIDTPICDPDTTDIIRRRIDTIKIPERFERCEIFLDYLRRVEENEFSENPEFVNSPLADRLFIPDIIENFNKNKDSISRKPKVRGMLDKD